MRWSVVALVCFAIAFFAHDARTRAGIDDDIILRRGDANSDGAVNVSDPVFITAFLFSSGSPPPCANQADANDDGKVDVSDAIYLNNFLFQGGSPPPAPGPWNEDCTYDSAPYPGCAFPPCSIAAP